MQHPEWLDRAEYPFKPHYLELPMGRMHYVDEGAGRPLVMVHGTPTWSFLYRHLIKELSRSHRVIAPDNIGFGLSDKPEGWSYRPADHARNLAALIEHLGLRDLTLVVHDFGGPIGLSYAVEHPENVASLVFFNTWMWSLKGNAATERASKLFSGSLGRFLYTRLNFSPRVLIKAVMGDKRKLTRAIHQHYIKPFTTPAERQGAWTLAGELIGSSDWYDQLWSQRERISDKPALFLWGLKDPTFKESDLKRLSTVFRGAKVITFPGAGHFVQEEEGRSLAPVIEQFLTRVPEPRFS